MKTQPQEFPKELRHDPEYRADALVFDALQRTDLPGTAVYYPNHELDDIPAYFAVWARGIARWVMIAVDGEYRPVGRDWERLTERGWREASSPMQQTIDAAACVQRDVQKRTGFAPFMVRALVFVDTDQSPDIEAAGQRCRVYPIWGTHCLGDDLERVADREDVHAPPEDYHIRKEVPPIFKPVDRDELAAAFFGNPDLDSGRGRRASNPPGNAAERVRFHPGVSRGARGTAHPCPPTGSGRNPRAVARTWAKTAGQPAHALVEAKPHILTSRGAQKLRTGLLSPLRSHQP